MNNIKSKLTKITALSMIVAGSICVTSEFKDLHNEVLPEYDPVARKAQAISYSLQYELSTLNGEIMAAYLPDDMVRRLNNKPNYRSVDNKLSELTEIVQSDEYKTAVQKYRSQSALYETKIGEEHYYRNIFLSLLSVVGGIALIYRTKEC